MAFICISLPADDVGIFFFFLYVGIFSCLKNFGSEVK